MLLRLSAFCNRSTWTRSLPNPLQAAPLSSIICEDIGAIKKFVIIIIIVIIIIVMLLLYICCQN